MMEKVACTEIADKLTAYADGELPQHESGMVAEHLAQCPDCRKTLSALEDSLRLTRIIWDDNLARTDNIDLALPAKSRSRRRLRYVAVAAGILLAVTCSVIRYATVKEPTFQEIEHQIAQAASATRLLAALELLAEYPDAELIVQQQYLHIVDMYPQTAAADKAKARIKELSERRL